MNYEGLKKLRDTGTTVSLWPRPRVMPQGWRAKMMWRIVHVDRKTVQLLAPSGHSFDAGDVIHHFQRQGSFLVLDAQVGIWGATMHSFRPEHPPSLPGPAHPEPIDHKVIDGRLAVIGLLGLGILAANS
jgi:hypothetical protein